MKALDNTLAETPYRAVLIATTHPNETLNNFSIEINRPCSQLTHANIIKHLYLYRDHTELYNV